MPAAYPCQGQKQELRIIGHGHAQRRGLGHHCQGLRLLLGVCLILGLRQSLWLCQGLRYALGLSPRPGLDLLSIAIGLKARRVSWSYWSACL